MMHKKIISLDVFKHAVCFVHGNRQQLKAFVKKEKLHFDWDKEEMDTVLDSSEAVTLKLDDCAVILYEREICIYTLIHEIVHAAKHIMHLTDVDDEEVLCYLTEYLSRELLPFAVSISSSEQADVPAA